MRTKSKTCQAWITNIGFPSTLDELNAMFAKHCEPRSGRFRQHREGGYITDIDELILRGADGWTAPQWAMQGDIAFLYLTGKGVMAAKRLLKDAEGAYSAARGRSKKADIDEYVVTLRRFVAFGSRFGAALFGFSTIGGAAAYYEGGGGTDAHFKGRLFAQHSKPTIFRAPLPLSDFIEVARPRQGVITPLSAEQFSEVKKLLRHGLGGLPRNLEDVIISRTGFREITASNWRSVCCGRSTRFLDESQLREYFADYLLREIADRRNPVLAECKCWKSRTTTGVADYLIRLAGHWIPVEAKLSIEAADNVGNQIKKYMDTDFAQGRVLDSREIKDIRPIAKGRCLVIDRGGVYAVHGKPPRENWGKCRVATREALAHLSVESLRKRLITVLALPER